MNESSTGGVQPAAVPTYHVQFGGTGWGVSEGSGRAGALLPSQRAAVAEAYRLAAARRSALVVVHYFDKTVQQEYVFHGETKPIRRL